MRLTALTAVAAMAGVMTADARVRPAAAYTLTICTDAVNQLEYVEAVGRATRLFAGIGVRLAWRGASHCPAGGLRMSVSMETPANLHPGALGYALPFDGTHIVLLWDRIQYSVPPSEHVNVLAHVMAHEITHVLQGVTRHSEAGMMKAQWGRADYHSMTEGLPWSDDDLFLMRQGLERRGCSTR
ncbi:MAG TPA: hypothetical protein VN736_19820 [Candidatus Limnocylindrales bacterium]|nr:hypothetical protein [Candidatus Limnocylindrales bacterium]